MVVFSAELIVRRRTICLPAPLIWFVLFLCYVTFQMIWSPGSINMIVSLYILLLVAIVIVNDVIHSGPLAIEIGFYVGVMFTFVYTILTGEAPEDGRISSTLGNPNLYSYVLVISMLFSFRRLLVGLAERSLGHKGVIACIGLIALHIYGITYLTGSRKGILIALAASGVLTIYFIWSQPIRRRVLFIVPLVMVMGLLVFIVVQSPQFSRVTQLGMFLEGGYVTDTSVTMRADLLSDAVQVWMQRPFTGWGLEQFAVVSGWGTYAHDTYVELLANHGIIGLLLHLMISGSLLVSLGRSLARSRTPGASAELFWAMTVVVMLLAWDLAAVSYYSRLGWTMLSVLIGLSVRLRREVDRPSQVEGPTGGSQSGLPKH